MAIEIKETMLEVLLYLFENFMKDKSSINENEFTAELEQAGFRPDEITDAVRILEGLSGLLQATAERQDAYQQPAIRIFTPSEIKKLEVSCRGFLVFLEQIDILDAASRELVIDRAMTLEIDEVDLEQLKWVILVVLFNQNAQIAPTSMINLLPEQALGRIH